MIRRDPEPPGKPREMPQAMISGDDVMDVHRRTGVQETRLDHVNSAGSTAGIPIRSSGLLTYRIPLVHEWMLLRHQGAKRSMPRHDPSHRDWRPDLDLLEDRWVLSGGIAVIGISPPPAIIVGVEFGHSFPRLETPYLSSAPPPWGEPTPGPEPLAGFHHEPGPHGDAFLFRGFQGDLRAP